MKITIGKKLMGGFGLALLFLFVIGFIAYSGTVKLVDTAEWAEHTHLVLNNIEMVVSALKDAETGQRGYIITGEERYLAPYEAAILVIDKNIDSIRMLTGDNQKQQIRIDNLEPLISDKLDELKETIDLRESAGFDAALALVITDKGKKVMDQIRVVIDGMINEENELLLQRDRGSHIAADFTKRSIVWGTLLAMILLIVIGVIIIRGITRPLRNVVTKINEIANAGGDLTSKLDIYSNDEIGDLSRAFNRMLEQLCNIMIQVQMASENIATSTEEMAASSQQMSASTQEISSSVDQMSKGAKSQSIKIEDTSSVMEELTSSIGQVARSSEQAVTVTQDTVNSARIGMQFSSEVLEKMEQIFKATNESALVVKSLGQSSDKIDMVVKVIDDISDQTNLLALNAAIEAARAGEAGRGFAVVAEEVRKLAESSTKSTSEIAAIITDIREQTKTAVESMERGSKEVSEGSEVVKKSGDAFVSITKKIEEFAAMIEQVSASAREQASGSEKVVTSVAEIAAVAEQTSSSTQEIASSTQEMSSTAEEVASSSQRMADMARQLLVLVGEFKLNVDAGPERVAVVPKVERSVQNVEKSVDSIIDVKDDKIDIA